MAPSGPRPKAAAAARPRSRIPGLLAAVAAGAAAAGRRGVRGACFAAAGRPLVEGLREAPWQAGRGARRGAPGAAAAGPAGHGCPTRLPATGSAAAAALAALALGAAGAGGPRGRLEGAATPRRAAADDEAAKLEAQLASVRAQLLAMEDEAFAERRASRARDLLEGATSGSVDAAKLRARLKEAVKMDVSEAECVGLLAACGKGTTDSLALGDLSSKAFDGALEKLATARAEEYRRAQAAEREEAARAAEAGRLQEQLQSLFTPSGDDGPAVRLLACLAYILPLADGIQYGGPLVEFVPGLIPLFQIFYPIAMVKASIPFGTLILLIAFQFLAGNQDLPYLVRFNLQQAAVMDILFLLPALVQGFLGLQLPESLGLATFVILLGCIVYAVVLNALGKVPDGLGFISDAVKRRI